MADAREPTPDDLVEARWRRYGKDRIYLRTRSGDTVGYVDLIGKKAVVSDARYGNAVRACLARKSSPDEPSTSGEATDLAEGQVTAVGWAPPSSPPVTDLPPPRAIDLANNVAGAAAKARRDEINAEAPVRNLVARVVGVKTDERSWRVGAKGEQKVGRELESLGPAWRVLHAIPVGEHSSDIDHLVIGPAGAFTINAKCHPNGKAWVGERAILVNGHRTDYLRNAQFEARRARALLSAVLGRSLDVQPVIVFVDLADLTIKQQPTAVHVTTRRRVVKWFRSRPPVLDPSDVASVYDIARLTTTWQSRGDR